MGLVLSRFSLEKAGMVGNASRGCQGSDEALETRFRAVIGSAGFRRAHRHGVLKKTRVSTRCAALATDRGSRRCLSNGSFGRGAAAPRLVYIMFRPARGSPRTTPTTTRS